MSVKARMRNASTTRPTPQRAARGAARRPAQARGLQRGVRRDAGVAIISALLVVALSAILVAGILWRQQVQVRRIENQRLLAQAQWVSRGALDWTRLILRSEGDTSAGITYLGGIWGVPIARTRLSDFLGKIGDARAADAADTYLSGSIEDAQAKFNLRNLVSSSVPGSLQVNGPQLEVYVRLLGILGLNGQLAKSTALAMRSSLAHSITRFQSTAASAIASTNTASNTPGQPVVPGQGVPQGGSEGGDEFSDKPGLADSDSNAAVAPLQMTSVDSLLDIPGYTPEIVERLRPFVTVLPTSTPLNMNTASAEVIAATVPGMNLSSAQAFVARRETVFFHNVSDVQLALGGAGVQNIALDPSQLDVNSSYFIVHGRIEHQRAEVDRTTLIYRDALTHTTRIVRQRDQL
jgi:general secretion pathway protein K